MKQLNFSTMGTFGDTVYSLCLVKILGGGNMYVKLHALDAFCRRHFGWPNALAAAGRYTKKDYEVLAPLLRAQDYLDQVSVWEDQCVDHSFEDHWKHHMLEGWKGNQTECYALAAGLDIHDTSLRKKLWYEPWLTPVNPIKITGKPVVVNRTPRHLHGALGTGWKTWNDNHLAEYAVFVGSEEEHQSFEDEFQIKIQHYKTDDLLHLARVIQGCEQFIGNQSAALSIAIGLGKTYWCEVRQDYEQTKTPQGGYGDVWFPRLNGFYF
jgi:hypothetical protein